MVKDTGRGMASVILVQVWRLLPMAAVIQMAGLSSIPRDLLEAAEVEGARFFGGLRRSRSL